MRTESLFIKVNKVQSVNKLFFFPHAGGSLLQYSPLFGSLEIDCEVYVANLPGRSFAPKQKSYTDFQTLMNDFYQEMKIFKSDDKVYLLGHSLGGLIVYDLVRFMEINLPGVMQTFGISSVRPPSLRSQARKISHLPEVEFLKEVEKIQTLPDSVRAQEQALDSTIKTLRNDFKLVETFPANKTNFFDNKSPGYIFGGQQDRMISEEALSEWAQNLNFLGNPQLFPGDHFYIYTALPNLVSLLLDCQK